MSGSEGKDANGGPGKKSRHHHHALRAADKAERHGSKDNNEADGRRAQNVDSGLGVSLALTPPARRFLRYGTPQFKERCPWTEIVPPLLSKNKIADNCVFLVRRAPKDGEGLAAWAAKIPTEYMMTRQTGCKLKLSYGPGVAVDDVWSTHSDATNDGGDAMQIGPLPRQKRKHSVIAGQKITVSTRHQRPRRTLIALREHYILVRTPLPGPLFIGMRRTVQVLDMNCTGKTTRRSRKLCLV